MSKSILLATGAVSSSSLMDFQHFLKASNSQVHSTIRLDIGTLETYVLSDGIVGLDHIQPIFAPQIDARLVNKEMERLHLRSDRLEASINVLLIRKGERLILLDTGSGQHLGANAGKLVASLKSLGLKPSDITDVVITHAHLDHIGGILDQANRPVFSSADYYIAEREFEFWMSASPDFSHSKGTSDNGFSMSFARGVLNAIKNKLHLFQYGDVLFSCLKSELAEGHTLGHTIFTVFSGDKSVKHIVDTFHTPLLVTHPAWGTQWDVDFDKAVKTRERIVSEGILNNVLFMSCHLPWPGLGYIDKINDNAYWTIYPYFNPSRIAL